MTKAKARQRAKANAAKKIEKRRAHADQPAQNIPAGQFDPKNSSISSPMANPAGKNVSGPKRGSARSR